MLAVGGGVVPPLFGIAAGGIAVIFNYKVGKSRVVRP